MNVQIKTFSNGHLDLRDVVLDGENKEGYAKFSVPLKFIVIIQNRTDTMPLFDVIAKNDRYQRGPCFVGNGGNLFKYHNNDSIVTFEHDNRDYVDQFLKDHNFVYDIDSITIKGNVGYVRIVRDTFCGIVVSRVICNFNHVLLIPAGKTKLEDALLTRMRKSFYTVKTAFDTYSTISMSEAYYTSQVRTHLPYGTTEMFVPNSREHNNVLVYREGAELIVKIVFGSSLDDILTHIPETTKAIIQKYPYLVSNDEGVISTIYYGTGGIIAKHMEYVVRYPEPFVKKRQLVKTKREDYEDGLYGK